jgi:hypothetical protein
MVNEIIKKKYGGVKNSDKQLYSQNKEKYGGLTNGVHMDPRLRVSTSTLGLKLKCFLFVMYRCYKCLWLFSALS